MCVRRSVLTIGVGGWGVGGADSAGFMLIRLNSPEWCGDRIGECGAW